MKITTRISSFGLILTAFCLTLLTARAAYDENTFGVYAPGAGFGTATTNYVDFSATESPNDYLSFSNALAAAYATNSGGDFYFTFAFANTDTFRGSYGASYLKRLILTSSVTMQQFGGTGTFLPVSPDSVGATGGGHGTTSSANQSNYNIRIGPIRDVVTDLVRVTEQVSQIGFVVLSRTDATFPIDLRVTASYSGGTTQSVVSTISYGKGTADTFFGFTAPTGQAITNLFLESFAVGTLTPVSTRIALDDIGFITTATAALPPPQVINIYPAQGMVHWASNGLSFDAISDAAIETNGISLLLNGTDVSSELVITGDPTNRSVSFNNLAANLKYKMEIGVSNSNGTVSRTSFFYTPETTNVVVFDSGGFTNETLYPLGPLMASTNNDCIWQPAVEPAEVVDLADGTYNQVLRRMQMGTDRYEFLIHSPVASGVFIVEVDARVSSVDGRLLDMSFSPIVTGGASQGAFLMWGTNALNYYNGTAWVPLTAMDTNWHRIKITSYVSGPKVGTFDLSVDNFSVGSGLAWRTVFSPVYQLRIGAVRGVLTEFGEVDNLVVSVAPEPLVALPVVLKNPAHNGGNFSFTFNSRAGITHVAEYKVNLEALTWTTLETLLGDGSTKTVTHTNPPAGPLFYRIRSFAP